MKEPWGVARDEWVSKTSIAEETSLWAIEEYYPSHCRFFDYVEQELNLKVVIAAHPKTNHTDYPEYFGKRHVSLNQLIPLIKKSRLYFNRVGQ